MASSDAPPVVQTKEQAALQPNSMFFVAKKAFQKCVPFTAVCELTYRCNFRCTMCYVIHENTEGELTTEEWYDVLDQLAELGTLNLELTGGEIFQRKDIWEILNYAQERKFLMHLFTNAAYIDEERAKRLKEIKNIMGFSVSLYGGDPQTFDKVTHVKGSYDKVVRALDILKSHGMKVRTKTPVTVENAHTVAGMRKLSKGALCASYQCAPQITPRDDGDTSPTDDRLPDEQLRQILRVEPGDSRDKRMVSWDSPTCAAGRSLISISPMGDVGPCIEFTQTIGNVRDKPIRELWYSDKLDYVRDFTWSKMQKCRNCSVTQFCSPCVGINQQEQGDITQPSHETCRITTLLAETIREKKRLKTLPVVDDAPGEMSHCTL
jgi:radical SAM protein with 4Fe4S-binding SPASM domain